MPGYVIYARKSTESADRQVLSIDSQIHELQLLAARSGVTVADTLTESRSAKAPGRPVFGELLRRIRSGQVNGVLCWKMDRLARNHLDTGQVLQALADGFLHQVITIDRTYTRDGNDRFIGSFELGIATKFIDDLRQNVKRGLRAKLQQGWAPGVAPVGYLNDRLNKTVVKDPERFDLVRRVWDLVLTGSYRVSQVRRIASDEWGLRTRQGKRLGGKPITHSGIYDLLENPFYMGLIRCAGETYVGAHPAMVTREEFLRVQEILGRPGRPRPQVHAFPFAGFLRCGNCGAAVTAEEHVKASGKRYVYYHCTRRKTAVVCREPSVPARELEQQFLDVLGTFRMPETVHAWLLAKAREDIALDRDRQAAASTALEQALAQAQREEESLLGLRLRDLVTDEVFLAKRREIQERRGGFEVSLRSARGGAEKLQEQLEATLNFAQKAEELFAAGTTVQKRMILEAVGSNYLLKDKKVLMQAEKPLQLIAESGGLSATLSLLDNVRTCLRDASRIFWIPDFVVSLVTQHTSKGTALNELPQWVLKTPE